MKRKRPFTEYSIEELHEARAKAIRESGEADARRSDIDKEIQARRTGVPARQPYPWTAQEFEAVRRDKEKYGF